MGGGAGRDVFMCRNCKLTLLAGSLQHVSLLPAAQHEPLSAKAAHALLSSHAPTAVKWRDATLSASRQHPSTTPTLAPLLGSVAAVGQQSPTSPTQAELSAHRTAVVLWPWNACHCAACANTPAIAPRKTRAVTTPYKDRKYKKYAQRLSNESLKYARAARGKLPRKKRQITPIGPRPDHETYGERAPALGFWRDERVALGPNLRRAVRPSPCAIRQLVMTCLFS